VVPITINLLVLKKQLLVKIQSDNTLKQLPKAKEQIVVGLYKFGIKLDNIKENGSNFSTAVTQGALQF
jgi:hypothetical protein